MISFLAILYGFHISALIYLFAYVTARAISGKGSAPFYIVIVKYLIYWKVLVFGFHHLPGWAIMTGLTGGIYLSLPVLYWINKKLTTEK